MSGITGWVAFDDDLTKRQNEIDQMTETMVRRGPDGAGTWVSRHAALGHRRLSVIDVPGDHQPMEIKTPAGSVVLVYSGRIFNRRELRSELDSRGCAFHADSEAELVLRAYLEWDEGVTDRLNGTYAFALWDGRKSKLVLVRDRMGTKPLYYHRTSSGVLFGSEPKAILKNSLFKRVVDTSSLRELVGFTKAPGWSLWKDMYEVEPGTVVTVDPKGIRHRTYWQLKPNPHHDDIETTVARIGELLSDIVPRQLVSDVPPCVLLSGGLDSSTITALAATELARRGEKLRSFSVDFVGQKENFVPDVLHGTPDSPFVQEVIERVGVVHRKIMLDAFTLADPQLRRTVVSARDIPIGLGDIDTGMYLLFREIRSEATVALSGEVSDDLFGGYAWFHHKGIQDANTFPWLAIQNAYVSERTALLRPELRRELDIATYVADQYAAAVSKVDPLDGEDAFESRMRTISHLHLTRLARALLDREDRLSSAAGVEVRDPFSDHRLVEYVYNVPWSMKAIDGREKGLLRRVVKDLLPQSVTQRVKSHYPSIQAAEYVAKLQDQTREVLSESGNPVFQIVDPAWVRTAVDRDSTAITSSMRTGLERVLDFYHWFDLYRPELRLG